MEEDLKSDSVIALFLQLSDASFSLSFFYTIVFD